MVKYSGSLKNFMEVKNMKKVVSLALVFVLVLTVAAVAVPLSGPYDGGKRLAFATGGQQGEYFSFGSLIANYVSRNTSTQLNVIASSGAMQNIEALSKGDVQLAFVQSDVGFYASRGTRLFDKKYENFSTVAQLYPEPVQIITLTPEIESIEDLRGMTVSVGAAGSGTYFNAVDVFNAYGMELGVDVNPVYESFGSSVEALKAGKIDAAFIVAGAPTPAVSELAKSAKVYVVSFDDKHIMDLIAKCPYYGRFDVPKATYGADADDVTVAVHSVIVARDDVSANDVYNFMYGVFENLDGMSKDNARARVLSLKTAASYPAVPYHPGAVKYLGEKDILVSGKK